jgi:unsaturated chondroitin disaccharide hydrolase
MKTDNKLKAADLLPGIKKTFELASQKVRAIDKRWDSSKGTPVFTVGGKYTTRGWTEWTQGFQYGCAILCYDATGDQALLDLGKRQTVDRMASHVTHIGVHDHGFNNLSTYGNLRRLMLEERIPHNVWELGFYEMAIKASGAVQAARWQGTHPAKDKAGLARTANASALGYIYSFNGPQSLFVDTMRSCRILGVAWQLGHKLMHENDKAADLLKRSVLHGLTTNQHIVFHGDSGHTYDVRGRTAHEAVFNRNDGMMRCRSSQQGYSPFSTWTRGLAWAVVGFAEELEFFATISEADFEASTGLKKAAVVKAYEQAALDTADHYINDVTALDGIPYWDDGAPGLSKLNNWALKPADPYNDHEPVDASAAAIAAQGLLRLGAYLGKKGAAYTQAGLTVSKTLMSEPYLSTSAKHEGLLLHSVYHRPNGWDNIPKGRKVPCDESSLWGDYHLLELALYLKRVAEKGKYLAFFTK